LKKLWPHSQNKGDQELKKNKPPNIAKPVLDHSKNSLYVTLLFVRVEDDL
jgi:hypothetical protein